MSFPDNLRTLRLTRGLTQPALAEKAGIEQSYLSKLENGRSKPSEDVLTRLAQALEVKLEALQNGDETEERTRRWQRAAQTAAATLVLLAVFLLGRVTAFYPVSVSQIMGGTNAMHDPTSELIKLAPKGIEITMVNRNGDNGNRVYIMGDSTDPAAINAYMDALRKRFGGSFQDLQTTPYVPGQPQSFNLQYVLATP